MTWLWIKRYNFLNCSLKHAIIVSAIFFKKVGSSEDAADASQETFLGKMRHNGAICLKSPESYLFSVARNLATDVLRARAVRSKYKETIDYWGSALNWTSSGCSGWFPSVAETRSKGPDWTIPPLPGGFYPSPLRGPHLSRDCQTPGYISQNSGKSSGQGHPPFKKKPFFLATDSHGHTQTNCMFYSVRLTE